MRVLSMHLTVARAIAADMTMTHADANVHRAEKMNAAMCVTMTGAHPIIV